MKDNNLLLEAVENIDSKMLKISYEKTVVDEISESFALMGEYFESLSNNYNKFNEKIQFVLQKMETLNNFVSENVLEEYYNIYRNVGDRVSETFHKLSSISDELRK